MCAQLFYEDTVFISEKTDKVAIFTEVYEQLLAKDLVTDAFLTALIEREAAYPTALDLEVLNPNYPNIAIPHTEIEFCKTTRVVPVKLVNAVTFNNMIDPTQEVDVQFLFMILNQSGEEQAGILAQIMDFINACEEAELRAFFNETNKQALFNFLEKHFYEREKEND